MMIRQSYLKKRDYYYIRFFYDVTCFIIINIIFMNIIFGIIIDTFAELRNKKNSDAKLMSKSCTICSVENTEVSFLFAKENSLKGEVILGLIIM